MRQIAAPLNKPRKTLQFGHQYPVSYLLHTFYDQQFWTKVKNKNETGDR